jgi:hypothetical protein
LACSKSPCNGKSYLLKAIDRWKHGKLYQKVCPPKIPVNDNLVLKVDIVIHFEAENAIVGAPFNVFATIGDWS